MNKKSIAQITLIFVFFFSLIFFYLLKPRTEIETHYLSEIMPCDFLTFVYANPGCENKAGGSCGSNADSTTCNACSDASCSWDAAGPCSGTMGYDCSQHNGNQGACETPGSPLTCCTWFSRTSSCLQKACSSLGSQSACENSCSCNGAGGWDAAGPCEGTLDCTALGDDVCTDCSQCELLDTTSPTYNLNSTNNTEASLPTLFSLNASDETALHPLGQYQLWLDNCTGSFTNMTPLTNFTSTPEWMNVTRTINSTSGCTIRWFYNFTDNATNVNNTGSLNPFNFTTTNDPPSMQRSKLHQAGNGTYDDDISTTADQGTEAAKYQTHYLNGTCQVEDYIFINVTVTDITGVDTVWVGWYNGTWYNLTMTNEGSTDRYNLNITNQDCDACTFDIYANDSQGTEAKIYNWTFMDYESGGDTWGDIGNWRKYVGLNRSESDFEYVQVYLHDYDRASRGGENTRGDRAMNHEQGLFDQDDDIALFNYDGMADGEFTENWCGGATGTYFEETHTNDSLTIYNLYWHFWWQTETEEIKVGWNREHSNHFDLSEYINSDAFKPSNSTKANVLHGISGLQHNNHSLVTKLVDVTDTIFNDNDINRLVPLSTEGGGGVGALYPSILSSHNYSSFIIFNLPDTATLQGLDTDSDGLSDYVELFTHYTDPKDTDTDNGGESDNDEVINSRDPLDPSDDIVNLIVNLTNPDPGVYDDANPLTVNRNTTFNVNATITCDDEDCSEVFGIVRYNASSTNPDTDVNLTEGGKPFYNTSGEISQSCGDMSKDQTCQLNWTINATGNVDSAWKIGVLFNSSSSTVLDNHTDNATITITGGILDVSLVYPPDMSVDQNTTFNVNATIACKEADCDTIYGIVRYNASSTNPDTDVNLTEGGKPFYNTSGEISQSCGDMSKDQTCQLNWTINATGNVDSAWKIGVLFNSSSSTVLDNHTDNATITIIECTESITLGWTSMDFGNLDPDTIDNAAPNNNDRLYNISNTGTCTLEIWIKGTDLENTTLNWDIGVGNLTWNNATNNPANGYQMTKNYVILNSSLTPAIKNVTTYYWLTVPPVLAGKYNGTIYICGNYTSSC